jgi:hypothetical protein
MIAFLAIVARGLANGASAEATLLAASASLPIFFLVGCTIGWIADRTVDESIRAKIEFYVKSDKQGASSNTRADSPAAR